MRKKNIVKVICRTDSGDKNVYIVKLTNGRYCLINEENGVVVLSDLVDELLKEAYYGFAMSGRNGKDVGPEKIKKLEEIYRKPRRFWDDGWFVGNEDDKSKRIKGQERLQKILDMIEDLRFNIQNEIMDRVERYVRLQMREG